MCCRFAATDALSDVAYLVTSFSYPPPPSTTTPRQAHLTREVALPWQQAAGHGGWQV